MYMKKSFAIIVVLALLLTSVIPSFGTGINSYAEPNISADRCYSFVTSTLAKNNGDPYIEYALSGEKHARLDIIYHYYDGGIEKTDLDFDTLSFTSASQNFSRTSFVGGQTLTMRYCVFYDSAKDEYYFRVSQRAINAYKALSETYPPANCLDLGVKNLTQNLKSRTVSSYSYTSEKCDENLAAIISKAKALTQGLQTDYQKTKAICEWLEAELIYNIDDYTGYPYERVANPYIIWDTKLATCYGYAQLAEIMLQSVNIPATTVRGGRGGSHVWNMVYINGVWTTLDPTNLKDTGSSRVAYWIEGFLPDLEYISNIFLYPFDYNYLSNMTDGGNTYATQTLAVYDKILKVALAHNGGTSRITNGIYVADTTGTDRYSNLEDPVKPYSTFGGWYGAGNFSGDRYYRSTLVTATTDHTLYAKWTRNPITVTFDGQGATTPPSAGSKVISTPDTNPSLSTLPTPPTKNGFVFDGWYTQPGGKGEKITATTDITTVTATDALTVYAKWTDILGNEAIIKVRSITITGGVSVHHFKATGDNTMKHDVTVEPDNASNKVVTWESNNPEIATVNQAGLVTFKGPEGAVRITSAATDGSGVAHYKDIKVVKNITKIRTPFTTVNITKGKTLRLPVELDDGAATVTASASKTFATSNKKIVTVDKNGGIKGIKAGKARVTVKSANGKTLTVNVVVGKKAVKLKKFTIYGVPKTIAVNKTKQLGIKLAQKKASDLKVTYKSSRPSVLSVDKAGKITAWKKGSATITVKVGNKTVKTQKINVK